VTGAEIDAVQRADYDRFLAGLRTTLGHDRFEEAWTPGRDRTAEQAVAAAREIISDELAMVPSPSS
jgi:hypothetical protein